MIMIDITDAAIDKINEMQGEPESAGKLPRIVVIPA